MGTQAAVRWGTVRKNGSSVWPLTGESPSGNSTVTTGGLWGKCWGHSRPTERDRDEFCTKV